MHLYIIDSEVWVLIKYDIVIIPVASYLLSTTWTSGGHRGGGQQLHLQEELKCGYIIRLVYDIPLRIA